MASYLWEPDSLKAVLETDNGKILSRIIAARPTILARATHTDGTNPIGMVERIEIENALRRLKILENERCPKTS